MRSDTGDLSSHAGWKPSLLKNSQQRALRTPSLEENSFFSAYSACSAVKKFNKLRLRSLMNAGWKPAAHNAGKVPAVLRRPAVLMVVRLLERLLRFSSYPNGGRYPLAKRFRNNDRTNPQPESSGFCAFPSAAYIHPFWLLLKS